MQSSPSLADSLRTDSVFCKIASASFRDMTCASSISFIASRYAWNSGEILPTAGAMSITESSCSQRKLHKGTETDATYRQGGRGHRSRLAPAPWRPCRPCMAEISMRASPKA